MPNPWVLLTSLVRWSIGIPVFVTYVFVFAFLTLFIHHTKIDFILKWFSRSMVFIAGIKVKAHGVESIDWSKPYVLIFNHTNIFDHFVIYSFLPQIARGIEREDHFKWPVHGLFLKRIGQVPIPPRGDTGRAILALEKAKAIFNSGITIAMAPEGTRTTTGLLLPFKKGAFHMAIDLQADILPVVLKGLFEVNKKNSLILKSGVVELYFEKIISTQNYSKSDVARLRDDAREVFVARLGK